MFQIVRKFKNSFHLLTACLANIYYGFPSRKIKVIGVTGTDGKTTTTHLIYHLLENAGKKVSMISSIGAVIAGKSYDTGFHVTTPSPFATQKFIRQAVDHTDDFFVLETTSHALDQYRVWGINYQISVLTNITHEHLDYHQSYEGYLRTKIRLLTSSKTAVVNRDDESYEEVLRLIQKSNLKMQNDNAKCKIITYGIKEKADVQWDNNIQTHLAGNYNKENILAAYAVGQTLGLDQKTILAGIKTFPSPQGRLDIVYDQEFKVIIDFAHTPNALEQLLSTVKLEILSHNGRLIHIFGAAGLRDAAKRPKIGEASGKYADIIILTEEDYRTEDVQEICRQITQGLEQIGFRKTPGRDNPRVVPTRSYLIITDRAEAIKFGISLAQKGDVVVITGKGHENSLCRGKKEYPWDEYEAVKQALDNKFL